MVIFIFIDLALHSYEGERTQCRDNRLLGEFELNGIPPMLRGQAELVTTFEVDANGLLKVSAQDRASGRKASISKLPNLYDSGL
jgi:L1 cell adhesion molecule like protein